MRSFRNYIIILWGGQLFASNLRHGLCREFGTSARLTDEPEVVRETLLHHNRQLRIFVGSDFNSCRIHDLSFMYQNSVTDPLRKRLSLTAIAYNAPGAEDRFQRLGPVASFTLRTAGEKKRTDGETLF